MNLSPNETKFDFTNYRQGRLSSAPFDHKLWAFIMEMVVKAKCLKSQITFHPGSYSSATVVKNGGKKEVTAKKVN